MPRGSSTVKKAKAKGLKIGSDKPRCGLCGKGRSLTKTACGGNGICGDEAH